MPSDKLTVHITADELSVKLLKALDILAVMVEDIEQRVAVLEHLPGVQEALAQAKGGDDGDPQASPQAEGEGAAEAGTARSVQ